MSRIGKLLEQVYGGKEDPQQHVRDHIIKVLQALNNKEIPSEAAHRSIAGVIAFHDLRPSQLHAIHQELDENPLLFRKGAAKKEEALSPRTKAVLKGVGKAALIAGAATAGYQGISALTGHGTVFHPSMYTAMAPNSAHAALSRAAGAVGGAFVGSLVNKNSQQVQQGNEPLEQLAKKIKPE